mgnify:FL=1
MSRHLLSEIERLRSRLRRLAILRAVGWTLFLITCAGLGLGTADYLFRFREGGMRLLLTGVWLAVAIESARRWLKPAVAASIPPVALAIWAERVFPAFRGKLAAAVEFARLVSDDAVAETDAGKGSKSLRRAALSEAESLLQCGPPRWPLPWKETWLALGLGAAALGVLCVLVLANPSAAGTAAVRLLNPFVNLPWPQRTHLEVESYPDRIAKGSTFEVVVKEASGRLPPDVTIDYRGIGQEAVPVESYAMERIGKTARHRRENAVRSFAFRVRGGDDINGEWHEVAVVEAPRINNWTLRLIPPDYTGWPTEDCDGAIKALVGTQVSPRGRAERPLRRATIELSTGERLDLLIERDGKSFGLAREKQDAPLPETAASSEGRRSSDTARGETSPWVVRQSGSYRLFIEAADGTTNPEPPRWEIRAVADEPPSVWVETDGRIRYSTPAAKVPLILTARDDLALRSVQLICADPADSRAFPSRMVYQGNLPFPVREETMSQGEKWGESKSLRAELDLAEIQATAGMTLEIRAEAEDYAGQIAESAAISLRVVDVRQLLDLTAADRNRILAQLSQLLEVQRKALDDAGSWQMRMSSSAPAARLDAEALAAVELSQRHIGQFLGDPTVGLPAEIARIVRELVIGGLGEHPDVRRLEGLMESLGRLDQEHGGPAERGLTQAVKILRSLLSENAAPDADGIRLDAESRARIVSVLEQAREHQRAIEGELRGILESWGLLRRQFELRRRLENIVQRQESLAEGVLRLGQQTVGRSRDALSPKELEDLRSAAQEQSALAADLDRLMEETAAAAGAAESSGRKNDRTQDSAPKDAEASGNAGRGGSGTDGPQSREFQEIVNRAGEAAIGARMRTAAAAVDDNRLSQALRTQRELIADLRDLLQRFSQSGPSQRDAEVWRRAAKELEDLIERQSRWRSEFQRHLQSGADRAEVWRDLGLRQLADAESASAVARELQSAHASAAGEAAGGAAGAMNRAAEAAGRADTESAASAAQDAEAELRRALADLNQRLAREAERQAALEVRRNLEILRGLSGKQKELTEETKRLAGTGKADSTLHRRQRSLAGEIGDLRGRWSDRPVADFILEEAESAMESAAQRLERQWYDETTVVFQDQAAAALDKIVDSLATRAGAEPQAEMTGQGGGEGQSAQPVDPELAKQARRLLAELKLVRTLQSDLLQRTEELEAKRQTQPEGDTEAELVRLSERQSQLRRRLELLLEGPAPTPQSGAAPRPLPSTEPPALIPPTSPGSLEDLIKP